MNDRFWPFPAICVDWATMAATDPNRPFEQVQDISRIDGLGGTYAL